MPEQSSFRESEHFDEIIRLTHEHGDVLDMEHGPIEIAMRLEEAALKAGPDDQEIRQAIQTELRRLLDSNSAS